VAIGQLKMPKCVTGSGNTAVGAAAADSLQSGHNNIFLGKMAGSAVVTGSGNVLIGTNPGSAAMNESIILSTGGSGAVRLKYTEQGDMQFAVRSSADVADPPPGFVTVARDAGTGSLVFKKTMARP
jgi:hypothetical protein